LKDAQTYPIGTPGKKWGKDAEEVVAKLDSLKAQFDVEQYGALSCSPDLYPLYIVKSRQWNPNRASILITGGVHGYETSGVQGAICFLETEARNYAGQFNFMVAPCVSPWGYETINRWNPNAVDPNRSFSIDSPSEEAAALMQHLDSSSLEFAAHFDLHETTDTDNTEFRPALAARDAVSHDNWDIEKVTHIAPPANDEKIIGETLEQWGVINYAAKALGLCMGVTNAKYVGTTEVYPDSPKVDDENCIVAQVAALTGGLDYLTRSAAA